MTDRAALAAAPAERFPIVPGLLVMVALFGVAFAAPTLASDFTVADLAIGGLVFALAGRILADDATIDREARLLFPGLAAIAVGTLLGATHVGLRPWILSDLVRDAGAFLAFFAVVDALRRMRPDHLRWTPWVVVAGMTVLTIQLLADGGAERATATFPNPNVPGHYLATAIGVCAWTLRGRARWVAVTIGLVGLAATGSFGGALQVVAMAGYVVVANRWRVWREVRRRPLVVLLGVVALPVALVLYGSFAAASSPDRLDRSGSQRLELWQGTLAVARDNPLGVGPGTIKAQDLLALDREPHNEYLAYLGERGIIGLAGLVALGVGLFRLGRSGGGVRMLLAGLAAASMFRETIHYRHLWLFLALLLVFDESWTVPGGSGGTVGSGRRGVAARTAAGGVRPDRVPSTDDPVLA